MAALVDVDAPTIYCPMPSAIHPELDRLEAHSQDWLREYGLVQDSARLAANNLGEAAARSMPVGPTDLVQIHCDVVHLAVALDDALGESGSVGRQEISYMASYAQRVSYTLRLLDTGLLDPSNRFEAPWVDLAHRIYACTDPARARRWAEAVGRWLDCVLWEETDRADNALDPNRYLVRRMGAVGAVVTAPLLEAASNIAAEDRDALPVQVLAEAAALLTGICNDLCSYRREARNDASAARNLVLLLAHVRGLPLNEALAQTVILHDQVMLLFLDLRDRLMPEASPALRQFLVALGQLIRGVIDYSRSARTGRYSDDDGSPLFQLAVSDIQPTLATRTPEFSSIRWWWRHLDS